MKSNAYQLQLDLFANSVTIRTTARKSPVTFAERDRDSDGRYAKYEEPTEETQIQKLQRELETERRRNQSVAIMLRIKDETINKLNEKLKENGITPTE